MKIDAKTKIYGIIGYPIEHTLSPLLHNAVFEKRGVNAVYLPFCVKPDELPGAIEGFKAMNISGLNITLPHKEQTIHCLDALPNPLDKAVGAINTLVLMEGRALGFNTDGMGFIDDLKDQFSFEVSKKKVLMIGAGGSARAVAFSMLQADVGELYVYNRTLDRAHGMVDYLSKYFEGCKVKVMEGVDDIPKTQLDLLVNCTSCGMKEKDPFPINPEVLDQVSLVYDLIYAPAETKLLKEAKQLKIRAVNGVGMLIHQACVSHRLWFPEASKQEIFEIMKKAYEAWRKS